MTAPQRITAICNSIPETADRVLDLGCARHDADRRQRGDLHAALTDHIDGEVIGIDTAPDAVTSMQDDGYAVKHADAEDFQLPGTFDAIVAGDLIEHLSRPGAMLECVKRHLRPGGCFVLSTPNAWCWFFLAQTFRGHVHCNTEHACWYDKRTLEQLLDRHGFEADIQHLITVPESVRQRWLRIAFRLIGKMPVSKMQRAPTLLVTATL